MAFTIEQHHVVKYAEDVETMFQQEGARLRECVTVKTGVIGKSASFNRIGTIEAATKGSRDEAHEHQNPDHNVRWANLVYYYNSLSMDPDDDDRVLADPKNKYVSSAAYSLGRKFDRITLAAAIGTAITLEDRTGTVALPTAQKIVAGSGPLTVVKLISAKTILDKADVPDGDRYLAIAAEGLEDLLNTTQVTSVDYNTVKALVNGQLNTFLGFTFKRLELVPKSGTTRKAVAWHKSAIGVAISRDQYSRIAMRHDRHDQWETYSAKDFGAVRIEDKGVVEVDYTESTTETV